MIGSPITHLSLETQHCQMTCLIDGQTQGRFLLSRENDILGHLQEVLQPGEKAVAPMGAIQMVARGVIHMVHVVHRQVSLFKMIQLFEMIQLFNCGISCTYRRLTAVEDMPTENLPWSMRLMVSLIMQLLQPGIEGHRLK